MEMYKGGRRESRERHFHFHTALCSRALGLLGGHAVAEQAVNLHNKSTDTMQAVVSDMR